MTNKPILFPDPINWLEGLYAQLVYDAKPLVWDREYGIAGIEMEREMRRLGIRVYGRVVRQEEVGFHVRAKQYKWAQTVLRNKLNGGKAFKAWNAEKSSKPVTAIDWIVDFLDDIFGGR